MKQHITIEQWEEIESIAMDKFLEEIKSPMNTGYIAMSEKGYPNIGEMIEFLGDDLQNITNEYETGEWMINYFNNENIEKEEIYSTELCDALWGAVKYKLKQ